MPDASGYVERTETLALRNEFGTWSDVTGSARCWNRLWVFCKTLKADGVGSALWKDLGSGSDMDGECKMVDQGYGDVWLTQMLKLKCRILTPGLGLELVTLKLMATLETLALRKELGSWSDVTGVQDVGTVL
ncbi:Proteasome Subunit Beta Type-7, partial [Manis pentadactyla]